MPFNIFKYAPKRKISRKKLWQRYFRRLAYDFRQAFGKKEQDEQISEQINEHKKEMSEIISNNLKTIMTIFFKFLGWAILFLLGCFMNCFIDSQADIIAIMFAYITFLVARYYNLKYLPEDFRYWKNDWYFLMFVLIFLLPVFKTSVYLVLLTIFSVLQYISLDIKFLQIEYKNIKKE